MSESVVEIIRASLLALGTGGVLLAVAAHIAERRNNQRGNTQPDQPEKTDPEGKR